VSKSRDAVRSPVEPITNPKENLMGKLTVTAFTTLDNVAEDPHLWSGAFFSDATGAFNDEVVTASDSMLLGRGTYDGFAAAWPSRAGDPFADKFNAMPKYVVSSTLERADWNNSTIIAEGYAERAAQLKQDQNLLVWGSSTLIGGLLDAGLLDELHLLVSPIVRGAGIRLFRDATRQHDLRVTDSTLLGGGMLSLRLTPQAA
jgi:dihydrofolate reductase